MQNAKCKMQKISAAFLHSAFFILHSRAKRASDGAQGRNRTADTRIFSPLLYQLSYLGVSGGRETITQLATIHFNARGRARTRPSRAAAVRIRRGTRSRRAKYRRAPR